MKLHTILVVFLLASLCCASTTYINRVNQTLALPAGATSMISWAVAYTPEKVVVQCTSGYARVWASRSANIVRIGTAATTTEVSTVLGAGAAAQWGPDGYNTFWVSATSAATYVTVSLIGKTGTSVDDGLAAVAEFARGYVDAATNAARMKSELVALPMTPYRSYGGTLSVFSPLDFAPGGLRHLAWMAYFYDMPRPSAACTATITAYGALNGAAGAIQKYTNISAYYRTNNAPGTVAAAIAAWSYTNAAGPTEYHTFSTTVAIPANANSLSLRFDGETAAPTTATGMVSCITVSYQY